MARLGKTALVAIAATLVGGALGACNVIVGAGDFAVGGGATGDDAGNESDGSIGPGPDTGSDAATSDAGGDAEIACGQGVPTTAEFQALAKACILLGGCTGRLASVSVSNCISWNWFGSNTNDPQLLCLKNAATCADVTTCTGERWTTSSECAGATAHRGTCNGSVAINCSSATLGNAVDCAKIAGTTTCGTYAASGGTFAGCVVKPSCSPDAGTADQCDTTNNVVFSCTPTDAGAVGYGQSCSTIGSACMTSNGSTGCFFKGPTGCSSVGATGCKDTKTATLCGATSTLITLDCSAAGGTCESNAGGTISNCVSPGCTLVGAEACKETCDKDGKTAHFCVGGAKYDVDCTKLGNFTGCVQQSNGYATCVP